MLGVGERKRQRMRRIEEGGRTCMAMTRGTIVRRVGVGACRGARTTAGLTGGRRRKAEASQADIGTGKIRVQERLAGPVMASTRARTDVIVGVD
jgi:hypothetical protein